MNGGKKEKRKTKFVFITKSEEKEEEGLFFDYQITNVIDFQQWKREKEESIKKEKQ